MRTCMQNISILTLILSLDSYNLWKIRNGHKWGKIDEGSFRVIRDNTHVK